MTKPNHPKSKQMSRFVVALFFLLIGMTEAKCQNIFYLNELKSILLKYHPVAKQANILIEKSKNELMAARGAFDPKVYLDNERKTLDGKNYYNYNTTQLKIPTWYGVTVTTGMDYSDGNFLNPETTVGRLAYTGIEVPLAKNLLLDRRRAGLQQAKLFITQSEQEQQIIINELIHDAYQAYFIWLKDYQNYTVYNTILQNNYDRHAFVVRSYQLGDKPAIDTVESLAQLRQIEIIRNDLFLRWLQSGYELSIYLWQENNQPYVLERTVIPDTNLFIQPNIKHDSLDYYLQESLTHPKLRQFETKLNILDIDRKLKRQYLLPQLDVKLQRLQTNTFITAPIGNDMFNNYKAGLNFSYNILQRDNRANYRNAKLKITETNYSLDNTRNQIRNSILYYYREFENATNQNRLYKEMLDNTSRLFEAEKLKYSVGESQLFIVNSRENKVLEIQLKTIENKYKVQKSHYALLKEAGILYRL